MYDTFHANYNNNNINDSIYMHYVIALWCNDIQYINTCDSYTDEHRKL